MPTFYNYTENGVVYAFDDVFVPVDAFRQGNLFTWGSNTEGQLGNNTVTPRFTPVTTLAGGANWKQVSCGYHTAAIKTDGTLWTWGQNVSGQIGDNTAGTNRFTPVTTFAGGTNWKQVAGGREHTAAIKTDGTLWTWGYNQFGAIGNNTLSIRSTPVTTFAGGTNWKQVDCGTSHTAAIKTDGTLWTWGRNSFGAVGDTIGAVPSDRSTPVTTFAGGTNWKQVSCGSNHTAAIKTDGTLWTWGRNSYGQLGTNNTTDRFTPVTTFAGGTNWKQVAGGREYTAAIKTDGTLWTWGSNYDGIDIFGDITLYYGQLGINNTTTTRLTPVTTFAGGTNWKQVSCGRSNTAAIKTDGTLWTWGTNYYGELGINNTTTNRLTPVTTFAGGTNWKQVDGESLHTAAVTYIDSYQ